MNVLPSIPQNQDTGYRYYPPPIPIGSTLLAHTWPTYDVGGIMSVITMMQQENLW